MTPHQAAIRAVAGDLGITGQAADDAVTNFAALGLKGLLAAIAAFPASVLPPTISDAMRAHLATASSTEGPAPCET